MSYLYDGLSFDILAEGRDATGITVTDGWHSETGQVFRPTSEFLRTNEQIIFLHGCHNGRAFPV